MRKPIIPESLYEYSLIQDPQFSPDGKMIAFVKMDASDEKNGYCRSIWLANAYGQPKVRKFSGSDADFCPRWSPDGSKLAFISARSGSPQAYVVSLSGGEPIRITRMIGGVSNLRWSPDGKWLAFNSSATEAERELEDKGLLYEPCFAGLSEAWSAKHREQLKDPREITKLPYRTGTAFYDGRYSHVYIISAEGGVPRRLSRGDYNYSAPEWSSDSRFIYTDTNREQSNGDENFELFTTIYRYDIETAEETVMVHEVTEAGDGIEVSPDGKWLLHTYVPKATDPHSEPYYAAVSPVRENAEWEPVSAEDDTIAGFKWAPDSEHFYAVAHSWGEGQLRRYSRITKAQETILHGCFMVEQISVDPKGRFIAYTASAPDKPDDLYVFDLVSGKSRQLTRFNKAFETEYDISMPKEIRWKSTNDVEIQGWYMYPRNYDPEKSYPLAVEIHGGPKVMWGNSFWHEFQVLASRGYFVFYCNPRGSAGYGADFARMLGSGGYTDMPDIMSGLDLVLSMEKSADPERLAVTGGSYGGFSTAWIVTHTDRFKAAVSQRGCYDMLNMFGSGDIPESEEFNHGGVPTFDNLADYWDNSPVAHAKNVTTPLLILHSELDYRVPISQAESFFAHLRRNGNRTVHMLRFPGEGHELSRSGAPHHRMERLYRIVGWFDKFIQHEGSIPKAVAPSEMRSWQRTDLKGWKVSGGKLVRTEACGNMDLAVRLLNRIYEVLDLKKQTAEITVNADSLIISLFDRSLGKATLNEVLLAKRLNERVF